MTDRYHVVLVAPPAFPFAEGLREVAESIVFGLRQAGRHVGFAVNGVDRDAINIILNPHLLGDDASRSLPPGTILCNFEQVHGDSSWMKLVYVDLVRRHVTWDYSRRNVAAWQRYVPDARVLHVPLGYVPELTRIPGGVEDIDVLFYGSLNERRERVLKGLEAKGLRVVSAIKFGAERDELIKRAKLVLNVHYYDSKIFEMPRVAYLIANRKAVVSEIDEHTDVEADLLPKLPQATALWKVNQRSFLVEHTVLQDGHEWPLIQTDSRMNAPTHDTDQDQDPLVEPTEWPADGEGVA